jgi:hypothetical protein
MDIDKLLHALENEENENIVDLDYKKISSIKNNMLQLLRLPRDELKTLHTKLKSYRYIDDLKELKYGSYIRWINLKNPENIKLTNGGIICDMKIKNEVLHITCKNSMHRFFNLIMSDNMIFQKLSDQEQVILSAMNFLSK